MPKRHGFTCDRGELREPRAGRARARAPRRRQRLRLRRVRGLRPDRSRCARASPTPSSTTATARIGVIGVLRRAPEGAPRARQHLGLLARGAEQTVDAAAAIARHTAEDDCAGLPEPELLARDTPDLDLYPSLGDLHRGGGRARQALRGGGVRGVEEDPQLRGRQRFGAADRSSCSPTASASVGGYPGSRH